MTTPILESIHKRFPTHSIDIVADARSSVLLSQCPYLGDIMHKDKNKFLRGSVDLLCRLYKKNYEAIVDLRTDGLAYLIRAKKRYTKFNSVPYGQHSVEQMMGVIHQLHGTQPIPAATIWLTDQQLKFAEEAVAGLPAGDWLALGPGCGGVEPEKVWPINNYQELCVSLQQHFSAVILIGGPGDMDLTNALAAKLTMPVINLAGKTDLLQAAAVLSKAKTFVGSDSGLGHIAAAVDTATLTLFSVDNPERCLPWGEKTEWLMGKDRDARNITVDEAYGRVEHLLAG